MNRNQASLMQNTQCLQQRNTCYSRMMTTFGNLLLWSHHTASELWMLPKIGPFDWKGHKYKGFCPCFCVSFYTAIFLGRVNSLFFKTFLLFAALLKRNSTFCSLLLLKVADTLIPHCSFMASFSEKCWVNLVTMGYNFFKNRYYHFLPFSRIFAWRFAPTGPSPTQPPTWITLPSSVALKTYVYVRWLQGTAARAGLLSIYKNIVTHS